MDYSFTTTAILGHGRAILRRDKDGAVFVSQEISLDIMVSIQKQAVLKLFRLLPVMPSFSFWRVLYVSYDENTDILLTLSRGAPLTSLADLYFEASAAYIIYSERELSVICAQLIDCLIEIYKSDIVKLATASRMPLCFDPSCFWFDDHGLLKCDIVHLLLSGRHNFQSHNSSWANEFMAALGKILYLFVTVEVSTEQSPPAQSLAKYIETMQCYTIPFVSRYSKRFSKHFIDFVNKLNQPSNLSKLSISFLQKSAVYLYGKNILNDLLGIKADPSGNSLLHKVAIECNKMGTITLDPSLTYLCRLHNSFGETALQLAVKHDNLEFAKLLIDEEAGCYINTKEKESATELSLLQGSPELAKLLISFEGKIITERGYTPLMLAASFGEKRLIAKYIQRQAKIRAKSGFTALHLAVLSTISLQKSINSLLQQKKQLVADSIQSTGKVEAQLDGNSITPRSMRSPRAISTLTKSCGRGNLFISTSRKTSTPSASRTTSSVRRPITSVQHLQQSQSLHTIMRTRTPSERANSRRSPQISHITALPSRLLSSPKKKSETTLSTSSRVSPRARPHTTQIFSQSSPIRVAENQVQSTYKTCSDDNIIMPSLRFDKIDETSKIYANNVKIKRKIAFVESKIEQIKASIQTYIDIISLLMPLEKQIPQGNGFTALMIAAKANSIELVKLLVKDEKSMVDTRGETALMIAVRNNAVDAVNELIKYEGSRVSSNRERYTALHLAVHANNIYFVEKLAPIENSIPQACYTLENFPSSNNIHTLTNVTALMMASIVNAPDCALILSQYESGCHEQLFGYTALMFAAYFNHSSIVELLLHYEAKETMHNGWTALMIASSRGNLRCCAKLATCESKITAQGLTALMIAGKHNFLKIVTLLYPLESNFYHKRVRNGIVEKWSCLTYAAAKGSIDVLLFLLQNNPSQDDIKLAINCSSNSEISTLLLTSR